MQEQACVQVQIAAENFFSISKGSEIRCHYEIVSPLDLRCRETWLTGFSQPARYGMSALYNSSGACAKRSWIGLKKILSNNSLCVFCWR